jgi:hypothetical protein
VSKDVDALHGIRIGGRNELTVTSVDQMIFAPKIEIAILKCGILKYETWNLESFLY